MSKIIGTIIGFFIADLMLITLADMELKTVVGNIRQILYINKFLIWILFMWECKELPLF